MATFKVNVPESPVLLKIGDHKIERFKDIVSEWIPKEQGAIKFRDMVLEQLDRLANNIPDFDTGYFKIEAGWHKYDIEHKLGRVPTRHIIYLVEDATAEVPLVSHTYGVCVDADERTVDGGGNQVGFLLKHSVDGNTSFIQTHGDYIYWSRATGYVRVLLWR